jgi:uncharacterized protein YecT (DUF1311 family)
MLMEVDSHGQALWEVGQAWLETRTDDCAVQYKDFTTQPLHLFLTWQKSHFALPS